MITVRKRVNLKKFFPGWVLGKCLLMNETNDYSFYPLRDKQAVPGPFTVGSIPLNLQSLSVHTLLSQRDWLCGLGCSINWELLKLPFCGRQIWHCVLAVLCFGKSPRGSPILWSLTSCGCLSCLVICQFFPARKVLEQVQFITLAWSPGTCPWLLLCMFSVFVKTYWSWESLWDWFQLGVFQGISSIFSNNSLLKHPREKERWCIEEIQSLCNQVPVLPQLPRSPCPGKHCMVLPWPSVMPRSCAWAGSSSICTPCPGVPPGAEGHAQGHQAHLPSLRKRRAVLPPWSHQMIVGLAVALCGCWALVGGRDSPHLGLHCWYFPGSCLILWCWLEIGVWFKKPSTERNALQSCVAVKQCASK